MTITDGQIKAVAVRYVRGYQGDWFFRCGWYDLFEHRLGWKPVGHKDFCGVYVASLGEALRLIATQAIRDVMGSDGE